MSAFRTAIHILVLLLAVFLGACSEDRQAVKQRFLQNGDAYAAQGKFAEAIIEFSNAVNRDPTAGDARLMLAEAYLAAGNKRAAIPEFIRAADLLPDDNTAQLKAGIVLQQGGLFQEAIKRARNILQRDPNHIAALTLLGNALAGSRNLDDAVTVLERAVEIDPERVGIQTNLAVLEMAKGNTAEAEAVFHRAVKTSGGSADAYLGLGNFYRAVQKYAEAQGALDRALELAPTSIPVIKALTTLYLETGRRDLAEGLLRKVIDLTDDATPRFALANFYAANDRTGEAIALLEALATDSRHTAAAMTRIALLQYARKESEKALATIEQVLKQYPRDGSAMTVKARLLLSNGQAMEAAEMARAAIAVKPELAAAHIALGRAQFALRDPEEARRALIEAVKLEPTAVAPLIELAEIHLSRSEIDTAIGFAEQAVAANRSSVPARLVLVRVLSRVPEARERVETELKTLLARYPRSPQIHAAVGALHLNDGNRTTARAAFENVLQLDPISLEAVAGLVTLEMAAGNLPAAKQRVETALVAGQGSVDLLLMAARIYELTGETVKVEPTLRRALKLDPSNPQIYGALGQVLIDAGRHGEATKEFAEVLRLQPRAVGAPTMLGLLAFAGGDAPGAEKWWKKALENDPRAAAAANNLAWLYAERGENLDLALELAQVAKARYPTLPEVNDTLGWVYHKKGMSVLAIRYLEQSVQQDPENPLYHFHLGMSHADRGEDSKARKSLERALALNAEFPGAGQAKRTLSTLVF